MSNTPNNNQPQKRPQWRKVSHRDARILIAAAEGKMPMMESSLKQGLSLETLYRRGETPLLLAAQGGHAEMVDFLLDQGANIKHVDDLGLNALCYAIMGDEPKIVKTLIDQGADYYHKIPSTGQALIDFVRDDENTGAEIKQILEDAQKQQRQSLKTTRKTVIKRRPKV